MMRRLRFFWLRLKDSVRDGYYTVRGWVRDWFDVLAAPVRAVRAFQFGDLISELRFGWVELRSLVHGFFWSIGFGVWWTFRFLARLPRNVVWFARHAPVATWVWFRTAPPRQVAWVLGEIGRAHV